MFDRNALAALQSVATEGGFEKAARRLHVTQSAISQRIRKLEERVGQVLVVRGTPATLTEAGRLLAAHAEQVALLEQQVREAMRLDAENDADGAPCLRVAINQDSLATWGLEILRNLAQRSSARVEFLAEDQDHTHELLRNGEVLGAVSAVAAGAAGCSSRVLGVMRYRCLATPAYCARHFPDGVSAAAVARAPAVVFNRKDDLHKQFLLRALGAGPWRFPSYTVPDSWGCVEAAAAGLGCAMLPEIQAKKWLERGELVEVAPDIPVDVVLYWHVWGFRGRLLDDLTQSVEAAAHGVLLTLGEN